MSVDVFFIRAKPLLSFRAPVAEWRRVGCVLVGCCVSRKGNPIATAQRRFKNEHYELNIGPI